MVDAHLRGPGQCRGRAGRPPCISLPEGFGYRIQEFVPGRSENQVTAASPLLPVDVLETQAGLGPDPQRCWSQFVTGQMTDHRDENFRRAAETGATGRKPARACGQLLAAHGPVALPPLPTASPTSSSNSPPSSTDESPNRALRT